MDRRLSDRYTISLIFIGHCHYPGHATLTSGLNNHSGRVDGL